MRKELFLLFVILYLQVGCSNPDITKDEWPPCCYPKQQLPYGNINRLPDSLVNNMLWKNTEKDEIAPTQKIINNFKDIEDLEFNSPKQQIADGIMPSSFVSLNELGLKLIDNTIYQELTRNIESLVFLDKNTGFISFSHPPSKEFAKKLNIPLSGIVGGTDIFYFESYYDELGYFQFKNINGFDPLTNINTPFWDSHPYAFKTNYQGYEIVILLWASDREKPFSKALDLDNKIVKTGRTHLYFAINVNGKWTKAQKIQSEDINPTNSSQGSPFLYCKCINPLLLFSTNRYDKTPELIEEKGLEDYDIDSVRISIDYDKIIALNNEDFYNDKILQNIILQIGALGTFPKSKDTDKSLYIVLNDTNKTKIDSTINTDKDDRFPFIPNPILNENLYIYLSSNRNTEKLELKNNYYLKNVGNYDIYRFPFNVPCTPPPPPPPCSSKLFVTIYDINKKQAVNEDVTIHLLDESNNVLQSANQNNFEFTLQNYRKYRIKGGFNYIEKNKDLCYDLIEKYCLPTYDSIKISDNFIIKDTIWKKIALTEIQDYLDTGKIQKKENQIYVADNGLRYEADFKINEKYLRQNPDKDIYFTNVQIEKETTIKTKVIRIFRPQINLKPNNNEVSKIKNAEIFSLKSMISGINTTDKCLIYYDTIFVQSYYDTVKCISLITSILNKEEKDQPVLNPLIEVWETNEKNEKVHKIEPSQVDKNNYKCELIYGKKYLVFGGSNFYNKDLCKERKLEYYYNCRDTNLRNSKKPVKIDSASIKSEKTYRKGQINTLDYISGSTIYDTVFLCPYYYEPLPCIYAFNEFKVELHKKVPYFQTAFWEVNTSKNLSKFLKKIQDKNSSLTKSFSLSNQLPNNIANWSAWGVGAKWIDLHPSNSYFLFSLNRNSFNSEEEYNIAKQDLRSSRIDCYRYYAQKVDYNLNVIKNIICNELVPAFNFLSKNVHNCTYCGEKKLIIRVEAWSDPRPVTHGWYITDDSTKKIIQYAECSDVSNFSLKSPFSTFTPVKIKEYDPLGTDNKVLSQLRAYYGYRELFDNYLKNNLLKEDGTPYNDNEILLPEELLDKSGNLLSNDKIDSLINLSKIIIIAKGHSTTPIQKEKPSTYIRCNNKYDGIRSIEVYVEPYQYYEGKLLADECCTKSQILIKNENILNIKKDYTLEEKKNDKFILTFSYFKNLNDANEVKDYLEEIGVDSLQIELLDLNGNKLYRLFAGPFKDYYEAENYGIKLNNNALKRKGIEFSIIKYK